MKQYLYKNLSDSELNKLCRRPKMDFESVFEQVKPIIDRVASEGDTAIRHFTKKFDNADPDPLVINGYYL